jgi:hypothetical protein
VLHELVAGHAQTLLAELRDADPDGGGLPRYVDTASWQPHGNVTSVSLRPR